MYYEINVSRNGQHFFATAPRSIQDKAKLKVVYRELEKVFTPGEGYALTVMFNPEISSIVTREVIFDDAYQPATDANGDPFDLDDPAPM